MRVTVTLEHRFHSTPDGSLWTQAMFPYAFWQRYLAVFDQVNIVARVKRVSSVPEDWIRSDGDGVIFTAVPYYLGPLQYLRHAWTVGRVVRNSVGDGDAVIMRVGSLLAVCLETRLRREGRPYGVEVLGDPYDVYAPGAVQHPLRPFFRWLSPRQLRRQCAHACSAAYVTESVLQRHYPPPPDAYSTNYSSVELPENALSHNVRVFDKFAKATLINIGTMAQMYKAQDVLIEALVLCVKDGMHLQLLLVGDGKHRTDLESLARSNGLNNQIHFLGQLTAGEAVREQLDRADLFILPSRTEGLPRVMIEAMARALPCIGSNVGGIPELLPPEDMVPPGDAKALAAKIQEVLGDPQRMNRMSARNLAKAGEYLDHVLAERRRSFYQIVKDRTSAWLSARVCHENRNIK